MPIKMPVLKMWTTFSHQSQFLFRTCRLTAQLGQIIIKLRGRTHWAPLSFCPSPFLSLPPEKDGNSQTHPHNGHVRPVKRTPLTLIGKENRLLFRRERGATAFQKRLNRVRISQKGHVDEQIKLNERKLGETLALM